MGVRRLTGERGPVDLEAVAVRLEASGQRRGARKARSLPSRCGFFDERAADALMLRVHRELQRLGEELKLRHLSAPPVLDDTRLLRRTVSTLNSEA